jgi:protein O-GlcNAc transferase
VARRFWEKLAGIGRAPAAAASTALVEADRLISEGNQAEQRGELGKACSLYRQAAETAPDYSKAHLNLGIGLEATGGGDAAIAAYEAALALDPAEPYANYNLGKLLYTRGSLEPAGRLLRQALEAKPDFAEARAVIARVLESQGDLAAAEGALRSALTLRADDFGMLYHHASVLGKLGRLAEAEVTLGRALVVEPGNPDAAFQLAQVLIARNEPGRAEPLLRGVLARRPDFVEARAVLSQVVDARGDLAAAATELEAVLKQRPDWADALYNYAAALKKLMRVAEAESALRRTLALDPQNTRAYRMLGSVLIGQCRMDEALALYRGARERCPADFDLQSAELFALNASEDIEEDALFAKHLEFGKRIEAAHPLRFAPFRNTREPDRRLRVGYVSGDFCYHVVTLFMIPVVERHDRSAVEVYCYSTGGRVDDYTRRLSGRADVWRESGALSAPELAEAINRDRIDILIDLGGHAGIPQLAVFAQQPAPVQATWLGYLNTTGMGRMHYRISDCYADPPGLTERHHAETLLRLPHSQWCYRPFLMTPLTQDPPCLRNGYVTFGSFNQALKLSRTSRRLWAEILARIPDSRLVVVGVPEGPARDELWRDLTAAGAGREKIDLLPYVSLTDYFRQLDAVDIALDTTPFSGGTTTCDALWMGVPVITVPGLRPSSRSAASILTTAGLGEWIARTPGHYVRLAVDFSGNQAVLAEIRRTLRARLQRSPLGNEEQFVRDLEAAYRDIWRRWCASEGPANPSAPVP